jgi:riboflavin synthase
VFTGIIEDIGEVVSLKKEKSNLHITVKNKLSKKLKIDQSVSHNGVCLTVVKKTTTTFTVTAIRETLDKTNLSQLQVGSRINLERAMQAGSRLDGHFVQGHIDQTAVIISIKDQKGSWLVVLEFINKPLFTLVDKGSVCIDGVSLTVVKAGGKQFSVAIIPYTIEHTIFHTYKKGSVVNIEFDVMGKYVERLLKKTSRQK